MDAKKLSARELAKIAKKSPAIFTHFLGGRTESLTDRTYADLAAGLTERFGRDYSVAELRGDTMQEIHLPLISYVGAGDEIVQPVEGDAPMDHIVAPPDMGEGEVTEVRGRSMLPVFEPGDLLFHRTISTSPTSLLGQLVVAKLKDGRRFVKILGAGKGRGRFTLSSLNPAYEPMVDQPIAAVAKIVWVKKRG